MDDFAHMFCALIITDIYKKSRENKAVIKEGIMAVKKQQNKTASKKPLHTYELNKYWTDTFSEAFMPSKDNMFKQHTVPKVKELEKLHH